MSESVEIQDGNIYLTAEVYEKYFSGLATVAVLERDGALLILPLQIDSGGGMLLKIKNLRGDRVIHAREFLASLDIDESKKIAANVRWSTEAAGLQLEIGV